MSQHPNARLTPRGRALLCERVGGGMRIADAAAMAGVSRQTAHKWLARARRGEPMTDRGCRPRRLARLTPPEAHGIGHKYTRPFSPWQNGKVERMNRTLAREWQYARAWESEEARASALASFIERYNWDRPHSACGGLPPMSRIVGVNNVMAHNS